MEEDTSVQDVEMEATPERVKAERTRSMADILATRQPNRRSADILLRPDLRQELERLEKEYQLAVAKRDSKRTRVLSDSTQGHIARLEEQISDLYDEIADNTVTFVFQDIGNKAWDAALNMPEHRPTPEQIAQWKELGMEEKMGKLAYNTETFTAWVISATAVDPTISLEEANEIVNTWSEGDVEALFFAAVAACKEKTSIPFGSSAFGKTTGSDSKSAIAAMPESLIPNSSDGTKPTD